LQERTGRRILAVPLIRDKTERSKHLQELNIYRKAFAGIKN
jgi:hypothetical protein